MLSRRAGGVPARLLPLVLVAALASACGGRMVGSGGSGGSTHTNSPPHQTIESRPIDKIDLLFMIDNSAPMADKQAILAQAVPKLVDRLVNPAMVCSDAQGNTIPATGPSCGGQYPYGPKQELTPVKDIHIGVITSSLGGHGAPTNFCNPQGPDAKPGSTQNDHGRLLPKVRTGFGGPLPSYQNLGFLNFDGTNGPESETSFANYVTSAGEQGCRFQSSLEAWYRFLVDPAPPASVKVQNNYSSPDGVDQEVLAERKDFLRFDSLLAIIMLTGEDDCSISDTGLGWLVARQDHMPRATSACVADPNSKCCRSCALAEKSPPTGCLAIKDDPSCTQGTFMGLEDPASLRCFQQKKRFGLDLLYPTQRYVNALTQYEICPKNADLSCGKGDSPVGNPIFYGTGGTRDPSLVFLAAITGVPWQDIATGATLKAPDTLQYKTADQLGAEGIWDDILGDVNKYTPPKDPLMQESIDPRSGNNPITGDAIAPPTADVAANPINGHEYDIPDRDSLQYACIFPLGTPRQDGQDCGKFNSSPNNPLCQNPVNGSYGTIQYFAKAYPGLRQLQVLKDFGSNAIVASICPKVFDQSKPDYGYNPALDAIVDRLKSALGGLCLPDKLTPDPVTKQVRCTVVEALPSSSAYSNCSKKAGRAPISDKLAAQVRAQLQQDGACDRAGRPACSDLHLCGIVQLTEQTGLESCLEDDPVKPGINGYCYVDGQQGSQQFVDDCPPSRQQLLRFVPEGQTPSNGAITYVSCGG